MPLATLTTLDEAFNEACRYGERELAERIAAGVSNLERVVCSAGY
jgi:hypothetical protein